MMKQSTHYRRILHIIVVIVCFIGSVLLLSGCVVDVFPQSETHTSSSSDQEVDFGQTLEVDDTDESTPQIEQPSVESVISETAQAYLHAGWLHLVQEYLSDTDRGNNGTLENGAVLFANHVWECWLNLDDSLQIHESVCIQTNLDGSLIQVGVRSGSISWNSAMDEVSTHDDPSPPYIADIDALLRRVANLDMELKTETVLDEDGKTLVQFSYQWVEESPIPLSSYDLPVIRWDYFSQFDPETGMIVSYQEWVTFEDGSQRISEQMVMQVFEIVDTPSEEVESYLSELEKRHSSE